VDTDGIHSPEPEWRQYELQIFDALKELAGGEGSVEFDQRRPGRFSGTQRQIDVWVTGSFAGKVEGVITAAVDCKHFSRKIDVTAVETFMGLVADVGADLGIMITSSGYTSAAKRRAKGGGFRLHVVPKIDLVDFDDLAEWEFDWDDHNAEPDRYVGDFYDFTPYGDYGTSVEYVASVNTATLLAGKDIGWGDDAERRVVIAAMMEHQLGRPPHADAVEGFLDEYSDRFEGGLPFEFGAPEVAHMAY
jgi:hypothetical protein